jgi:thiamine-phosphate pyrophosphorylase
MTQRSEGARLYLVTPPTIEPDAFALRLAEALSAGDLAAVLIATAPAGRETEAAAAKLVPIIQDAGAAALICDDTRLAGRVGADGVHIGFGSGDLMAALEKFRGKRIVGAGDLRTRHAAMQAGETGADYVFFGRPHGDTHEAAHPKALELAEWWSEVMEIPAVVMAGSSLTSIADAAATGAAFVAVHQAVWSHEAGPGEAIRHAVAALEAEGLRAA